MVLGATLALASCVSRGTADRIEGQRDSLQTVVGAKDSLINAIFEDINSISENLAAIKTRESLLTVNESVPSRKSTTILRPSTACFRTTARKSRRCSIRRLCCARPICASTGSRR